MRRLGRFRLIAMLLALGLVVAACSGGSGDDNVSVAAGGAGERTVDVTTDDEAASVDGAGSEAGARSGATATGPARSEGTITADNGVEVEVPEDGGPPVANLFTPEEDRIGIHDDRIVFCGHAATTFGPAFNTSERDLNVYWEEVGEIHGRTVEVTFENDNYDPTTARQAAQACKDKNPFILLGGIGFDQIPAVRKFAEDNRILYYHHIAAEDLSKRFSFSPLPSVETVGRFAGEWVGKQHRGKRIGVIYRESENWEPGHQTFLQTVKAHGGNVVADIGVQRNQGSYFTEMNELRLNAQAEVVFVWENALAATTLIQEAKGQNYHPQFVIFPFNVTTDALGRQALNPPIEGIATWPAYSPGDYSGPFEEYADEIREMERAYAERRPGVQVTDIHWQVWLAWKALGDMLLECGRDCTRNKILGLSVARVRPYEETRPSCPVDFTRNGHVGGFWATMYTAYEKPGAAAGWRHMPDYVCRESF